jgi:L-lactate dehydrogenase complex protein LldG
LAVPDLEVAKPGWEAGALYDTFKTNAGIVSARVDRAADNTEAALKIKEIILQTGAKKVVAAPSPLVDSLLPDDLWAAGTGPALHRKDLRRHAPDVGVGISAFDLAIVETGTLVQDATNLDCRLVSTLPPVHVALVPTDRIVPTLQDALELYGRDPDGLPPYLAFISGPSRTADIERVLTIGVHGPSELYIIFIDRPGGETV